MDAKIGTMTLVAGTGESGYSGDGGPAIAAGNLSIADTHNHRLRVVGLESVQPPSPDVLMDEREELLERLLGSRGGEIPGQKPFALSLK